VPQTLGLRRGNLLLWLKSIVWVVKACWGSLVCDVGIGLSILFDKASDVLSLRDDLGRKCEGGQIQA